MKAVFSIIQACYKQCSPRAGLARRVMGGLWAGPGPGAKFWQSTGYGRVRAGKFENPVFVPYEVFVEN